MTGGREHSDLVILYRVRILKLLFLKSSGIGIPQKKNNINDKLLSGYL